MRAKAKGNLLLRSVQGVYIEKVCYETLKVIAGSFCVASKGPIQKKFLSDPEKMKKRDLGEN